MINQKSFSSTQNEIPEKWKERFLIKRIDEDDIEITLEERNMILQGLNAGMRFVQVGKYTLMLNAIKSIDPKWGKKNIPPCPSLKEEFNINILDGKATKQIVASNEKEIELWKTLFAVNLLPEKGETNDKQI